jgi:activator of HSP90 ATPase
MESLNLEIVLPGKPEKIFSAWLDSEEHARFTGSAAKIDAWVGGNFAAWDGYISGKTLVIAKPNRIVQAWRTSEFPEESPDSQLELLFNEIPEGTHLILNHTQIPDGQGDDYKQGWLDYYFEPMKAYFKDKLL